MKRKYIILPFLGLATLATIGVLSLQEKTYSQEVSPIVANQCGADECCLQYNAAIESAEQDWEDNLQNLIDQEKPASDMVDEAYENLRTYNCWLEYICRSVQFSGYAPIESVFGTGITSQHVGQAPGCQEPEDLQMEAHYASFVEKLNSYPSIFGSNIVNKENLYQKSKINYFPACMGDKLHNNATPDIIEISNNFEGCKSTIEAKFGCSGDLSPEDFKACVEGQGPASTSMTLMETTLKKANADQRASAMEIKLGDIVSKLHGMEAQVTYLSNYLTQLDQRLGCIISICT